MIRGIAIALLFGAVVAAQAAESTWLDRPLANWNIPGGVMPSALGKRESIAEITKRCAFLPMKRSTPGERAVADAGRVPFHMFDRHIIERDVEIVGGLADVDGMCQPLDFNVFVFVNGQLAGTLSPNEMSSRTDGSIGGAIRLAEDTISAEFARYGAADALCCPSERVTVRYRIDRTGSQPVIVPVAVQPTRR